MAPEAKAWDGAERRTKQLPVGHTALKIAGRTVDGGNTYVDTSNFRESDLADNELTKRVGDILDIVVLNRNEDKASIGSEINLDTDAKSVDIPSHAEGEKPELTPEQAYICEFKTRFDSLPQLHQGVQWADVEKSLKADPEQLRKLQILDEKGHSMNLFGEENGEFIFVSGWNNYEEVSTDHRNIAYDLKGQKFAERQVHKLRGNAVDIAGSIGTDLADPKFHEQLRKIVGINGGAWLKTDATTRKNGRAFIGHSRRFQKYSATTWNDSCSFRAVVRIKKT